MTPRTIISAIRALSYAGLGTILGIKGDTMNAIVIPLIAGAVGADFLTWLVRSIILFPQFPKHGLFDGLVNVGFGWLVFAVFGLGVHFDNSEEMAVAFLSFLGVLALKIGYYAVEFIAQDMDY